MLASADPNARFKLVCNRLARGRPQRRQTFGQQHQRRDDDPDHGLWHIQPGDAALQRRRERFGEPDDGDEGGEQQAGADQWSASEGGGACCFLVAGVERQKVVAVPHGLDEDERAVEHQRDDFRRRPAATC